MQLLTVPVKYGSVHNNKQHGATGNQITILNCICL